MILHECLLRSFGSFKQVQLSFDPKKPLQILFGNNEAGKTTFSRAFLSLIYGIEKNSQDAYLASRDQLLIEGLFETGAGTFCRVIRDQKADRKMTQKLLSYFPEVSREVFFNSYILNHETLQKGAENLLKFMGHFNLEFLESKGLFTLKKTLLSLEQRKKDLFKERGRNPLINQLFTAYQEKIEQKELLELSVSDYEALDSQRKRLLEENQEIQSKISQRQTDLKLLDLQTVYLEQMERLSQVEMKRSQLQKGFKQKKLSVSLTDIDLEKVWIKTRPLFTEFENLQQQKLHLTQSIEKHSQALEEMKSPEFEQLRNKEEISALSNQFKQIQDSLSMIEEYEIIVGDLKHEERMIAKLSKELFISLEIKDFLVKKEIPNLPDLKPLEKKYNELKLKWDSHRKKERALEHELVKYQSLVEQGCFNSFKAEEFDQVRRGRKELEKEFTEERKLNETAVFNYISLVQKESLFVDFLIEQAEAFAEYKKNQTLLEKFLRDQKKLVNEKEEIEKEIQQLEREMQSHSFSQKFSFHEFSLFTLYLEKIDKLFQRVDSYHKKQEIEQNLIERIKRMQKDLEHLLLKMGCSPSEALKDSIMNVETFLLKQKELDLLYQKKAQTVEYLSNEMKHSHQKLEQLATTQSHLLKSLSSLLPSMPFDEVEIRSLKEQLETHISQRLLLTEINQERSQCISQIKTLEKQLMDFGFTQEFDFMRSDILSWSESDIKESKDKIAQRQEQIKSEIEIFSSEYLAKEREVGQVDYKMSTVLNNNEKLHIEKELKNTLFDLEQGIEEYLITHLSTMCLMNIAEEYQSHYQEHVLACASELFREMTNNRYEKITIDLLKEGTFLYCHSKSTQVGVDSLSLGTRTQLYLSLKLAFIQNQVEAKEPFPILLDDLFVQFDDERALSGLKVLEKLAQKQQVFFLTHHKHLLELIKQNLDEKLFSIQSLHSTPQKVLGFPK